MKDFFGYLGRQSGVFLASSARLGSLFVSVSKHFLSIFYKKKVLRREVFASQTLTMGWESVGIISLTGASVGAVLALQAAYSLKPFGALIYTGSLVCVAMARELGPLIAAIVICGRIGARIAAELGSMKVQEEVDALTTMGISPIRFLVLPRCLALTLMLPCLTVVADLMGMVGGYLTGVYAVGINPDLYISNSIEALVLKDVYTGLGKSVIFSVVIALVSCQQGLSVSGGADAVGKATTQAVVLSIILIIVVDVLATAVIYYAF